MSVLYGIGPVLEALRARRRRVLRVWLAEGRSGEGRIAEIRVEAERAGTPVEVAAKDAIQRRAGGGTHQGVVAEAELLPRLDLADLLQGEGAPLILALDGVQDPQNLGAVLRVADGAGARGVVVPRDRAAPLTPAAIKVAEGAAEYVPVVEVTNLKRALTELKAENLWVTGLEAGSGQPWYEADYRGPTVIVLGAEGQGMRRLVREACDRLVGIPMRGRVGSLNVATAAAVVVFEVARQRGSR